MSRTNFYCAKKSGDSEFSIEEWNKSYQFCIEAGLSEKESNNILFAEIDQPCKEQCEACMNIVLDTQIKNRKLREERAKSNNLNCIRP